MLWEAHQYGKIVAAEDTAERAERKAESMAGELRALQRHLDRLSLACQAMWELLRDNTDLTEAELESKMLEIDLRDGVADGKMGAQVLDCPACGSKTNSKRATCIMCGAPITSPHKFGG